MEFSARAESLQDLRSTLKSYVDASSELLDSLDKASDKMDPAKDRDPIAKLYSQNRRTYLSEPLNDQKTMVSEITHRYVTSLNDILADFRKSTIQQIEKDGAAAKSPLSTEQVKAEQKTFNEHANEFDKCLNSGGGFGRLQTAPDDLDRVYSTIVEGLAKPIVLRRNIDTDETDRLFTSNSDKLESSVQALNKNWEDGVINGCCTKSITSPVTACEVLKTRLTSDAHAALKIHLRDVRISPAVHVPDPLASTDGNLPPAVLAALAKNSAYETKLRAARNLNHDDLNARSDSEIAVYQAAESACTKARDDKQNKSKPFDKELVSAIGKTLKCHVMPALTTYFLDTEFQRMSTALAAMPLQAKDVDMNCDPREIEAYNAMRPTDPNVIAQQWGIPQMANPPYINSLRMLPPLQSPFPIVPLPNGGLSTPFGNIGVINSAASGITVVSGAGTRVAASRGVVTMSRTPGRRPRAASRGLIQGQSLTLGVRQLANQVSQGKQVLESLSTLRQGASNTRSLARTMVANNTKRGLVAIRTDRTQSANTARSLVRNLGAARASRTTASGVVSTLRGRAPSASTPVSSIGDVQKSNEQERLRIEGLARMYMDNIETARAKAETARQKIQQMILERDSAVSNILAEILNKPPKEQAQRVMRLRQELLEKDKALALTKAEYDTYAAAVLEQSSLVRQLALFGTQAPNNPGFGGGVDPRKLPTGFPQPSPGTGGSSGTGRSTRLEKVWEWFNPIQSVFAAAVSHLGIYGNEKEWRAAWDKFVGDYEHYAKTKTDDEKVLINRAGSDIKKRMDSITTENATDLDTETLVTMDLYSQSLSEESQDLLSESQKGHLGLTSEVVSTIRKIRGDALETKEALDELSMQFAKTYPRSDDENDEVWWSMLPEMAIY